MKRVSCCVGGVGVGAGSKVDVLQREENDLNLAMIQPVSHSFVGEQTNHCHDKFKTMKNTKRDEIKGKIFRDRLEYIHLYI